MGQLRGCFSGNSGNDSSKIWRNLGIAYLLGFFDDDEPNEDDEDDE